MSDTEPKPAESVLGLWGGSWKCFSLTRFGVLLLCLDYFIEKKNHHKLSLVVTHDPNLQRQRGKSVLFWFSLFIKSVYCGSSFLCYCFWIVLLILLQNIVFSTQLTAVKLMHQVFNQNSSSYSIRWHWLRFCKQNSTKSLTLQFDTHELQVESSLQTQKRFWLKENHRCSLKP